MTFAMFDILSETSPYILEIWNYRFDKKYIENYVKNEEIYRKIYGNLKKNKTIYHTKNQPQWWYLKRNTIILLKWIKYDDKNLEVLEYAATYVFFFRFGELIRLKMI